MSTPQPQPIRVTNTHSTNNHHSTMSSTTRPMVQTPQNFHSHPKTSPNNPNVESQQLPSDKAVCGLILKNWKSRHSTKTLIRKAFHVQDFESSIPHDVLMMAAQELSSVVSSSIHDHGHSNKSGHMISKPHHMMMKHLNKTKQGKQSSRLSSSVGTKLKFHQYQPSQQAFLPPHQESNNLNCQMMVVDSGELTTSSVFVDEFPSSASPSPPYSTNHIHAQSSSTCCNSQMYPPSGMMEPLSSITTTSSTVSKGLSSRSHPGASGGTTTTTNNTPLIYIEKQVPFKFATLPHQSAPSMKKVLSPPPPTPPSSSNRIVVMHDDDDDHAESKENQSRRHSPPILNNLNSYSTLEWPLPSNSSRGNHSSNTTTNPDGEAAYNGSFSLPPLLFVHSNNNQNHSERTLPSFSQLINQLGV
ncbi:hypothetical protein C9374_000984 [Naegleria lovaniensis]|uniref:Uncharacterized protein n=1 Tax=Naegleria lovaniensis TaxID=51637 RepID=A0AA88KNK6_NAELO|nr:uncharacterized protein C9374_000984 [Naegleria lovaniensis]KAG2388134.1 hypothetical protein C9374_000984 [Naegleria lovaniensis]